MTSHFGHRKAVARQQKPVASVFGALLLYLDSYPYQPHPYVSLPHYFRIFLLSSPPHLLLFIEPNPQ